MQVGVVMPSGLVGEFVDWRPEDAWSRALELARLAKQLGFAHVWVAGHLHGVLGPAAAPTLEAFTLLTAIAGADHADPPRSRRGLPRSATLRSW